MNLFRCVQEGPPKNVHGSLCLKAQTSNTPTKKITKLMSLTDPPPRSKTIQESGQVSDVGARKLRLGDLEAEPPPIPTRLPNLPKRTRGVQGGSVHPFGPNRRTEARTGELRPN